MKVDLLDIVFEENDVVFRDKIGFRVGERKKTTEGGLFGSNGRRVDYLDQFGNTTAYARECGFRNKYVQFYDKNGKETIRAIAYEKRGQIIVEYQDKNGKVISSRYADKEKINRNTPHSMEDNNDLVKEERGGFGGSGAGSSGGLTMGEGIRAAGAVGILFAVFFVFVFVSFALAKIFEEPLTAAYANFYSVLDAVKSICLYGIAPAALVIGILRTLKAFRAAASVKAFEILQILLCAAAMVMVSVMLNKVLQYPGDTVSGWNGVKLYFMGYVPLAVYALLNRILVSFWKKDSKAKEACIVVGLRFVNWACIFGTLGIFLARATMLFVWYFGTQLIQYFGMRIVWQALLAVFMFAVVRSLYRDVLGTE